MSARQIRAGRAFVELFATDTALSRTLEAAAAKVKKFGQTVTSIGLKAGVAGGAILAPLGKSLFEALGTGAEIKRISQQYGETTETISELSSAFNVAGLSMSEFSGSLEGLKAKIKAASDAGSLFDQQLVSIGRGRDLERLPVQRQFETLLDALARIPDATQRTIKAQEWFGNAMATKMLPYLGKGSAGLKELRDEANKRGWVMPKEDIERSADAMRAWQTIMDELGNTIVALGSALLPTKDQTKDVTTQIKEAFKAAREWVAENKNLIIAAAGLGAGLLGLGVALLGLKVVIGAIAAGLAAVGAAFTVLLSPVGIAVAALAGIAVAFVKCTKEGQEFRGKVGEVLESIGSTFKETWGGIVQAIKDGDLQGALKIAGTGLKAIWYEILLNMKKAWNAFVSGLTDVIKRNPMLLPVLGAGVGTVVGGPLGTAAGLAAGFGANQIDFEKHLTADLMSAEEGLRAAKGELRNLLAAQPGAAKGQLDQQIKDAMDAEKKRFESYAIKQGQEAALNIGNRQKGIFSGPAQQQLGYGDTVAKRQLDVQKEIAKGVAKGAAAQEQVRDEMQKVLALVTWN